MADVEQVKEKVRRILMDFHGTVEEDRDGDFVIRADSTAAFVRVRKFGDDATTVTVFSPFLREVPLSDELYKWVAIEGTKYTFGYTYLFIPDGATTASLGFRQTILGDFLDPEELKRTAVAIAATANTLDDELKTKFGGKRMTDS